jgi:predicted MPP superfamily phosphohydrolase
MIRILHISDLHFDTMTNSHHAYSTDRRSLRPAPDAWPIPTLVDEVIKAVRRHPGGGTRIDGIAVTGDLVWFPTSDQYELAISELERLRSGLGVEREHFLLIPGNHDVDWNASSHEDRFARFRDAFERLTSREWERNHFDIVQIEGQDEAITLVGVNSAIIETEDNQGIGAIGEIHFEKILTSYLPNQSRTTPSTTALCMHHHLLPVAHVERYYYTSKKKRTSVTLDAKAILDLCQRHGINLVLHGHQHQPNIASYASFSPLDQAKETLDAVWLVGAGSAGVADHDLGDANRRHFQLLEFSGRTDRMELTIHAKGSSNANRREFVHISSVPLNLQPKVRVSAPESFCAFGSKAIKEILIPAATARSRVDSSDLALLFLRCARSKPCQQANEWLRTFKGLPKDQSSTAYAYIEAIYDLYGDYDLLVKARASDAAVGQHLIQPIAKSEFFSSLGQFEYVDVAHEYYREPRIGLPAGTTTRSIKAFVKFSDVKNIEATISQCSQAAEALADSEKSRIAALNAIYIGKYDQKLIAEYYLACGAFYALSDIITRLEAMLAGDPKGPTKVTLLAQFARENLRGSVEGGQHKLVTIQ